MGAENKAKGRAGGRGRRHTPRRARGSPPVPVPPPAQARGCRGRSPLHEITLIPPLPAGKSALRARVGGMGERNQAKGRVGGRRERQAPPAGAGMAGAAGNLPPCPPRRGQRAAGSFPPRCAASPFCTNPAAIFGTGCGLTGAAETYIIGREIFDDSEAQ